MSMFKKVKSLFDNKDQPPGSSPNGSETSTPSSSGAPKIWAIPPSVREQFAKGGAVRYNIKVVLRGARRVGKSSVMARLQGTFQNAKYAPSDEISAATIYYQLERPPNVSEESYEVEAAKVDLWDVVDEGRAPPPPKGQPSGIPPRQPTDARSVDVYQNCHAAVFIVDVTRRDSWEYVVEEVKKVPSTCSICIALNFCDAPKPHAVTEREVVQLSNTLPRCCTSTVLTACQGQVPPTAISFGPTWVSLSALTGQGIDLLRSFLAVPVALERLQTLESRMKSIYSEIEVHQGMLLQRRAMEEFEAKEKQKSQSQTRENSVTAPPPDVEAKNQPGPVVEKPRQVEPVKKQPEARSPSPKPQPPKEAVTAPQAVPVKQPTPSPVKKPSPPQAREEPTVAVKPAAVAPPQEKPAPVATPTPPQPTVATKKVVATSPASQRTPEEEKRLQEDFYGDITEEDEESIEESEEESDDEPILTPAARKAQLLQQQREQNATTAVVSSPVREAPVEPIPTRAAAKTDPPQGVAGSKTPTPGSSQERSEHSQELPTPPVEEVAPEEPAPTHKPTWQEDADKLANITVEDNVEGAAGAGKGLDAFLDDSEEEEEPQQKPDEAIEEKSEVEEEVAEKEDSPSEEEPAPVPRGRQHRDPTRQRGNAPVTAATPEPSAAAAAPISDEVSEMLKQMADAMREEIKEGKKAKKSKKSKDDAEEGGEGTEKKKEKKPKSEKRHEGDGEKDKSDKKEKSKKEKKDKKKVDEE